MAAAIRLTPGRRIWATLPAREVSGLRVALTGLVLSICLLTAASAARAEIPNELRGQRIIGVRVGGRGGATTFALRRQEAACIQVWPTGA